MTTATDRGISHGPSTHWTQQGHCATDPQPFTYAGADDARPAQLVCHGLADHRPPCPVRRTCLAAGLAGRHWGVWGGRWIEGRHT